MSVRKISQSLKLTFVLLGQIRSQKGRKMKPIRSSNPKSSAKSSATDLIARLGYLSSKSQEPSSCEIEQFSVEQFFNNYVRRDLSCVMTSDHLEHGFCTLARAAKNDGLRDLSNLLDQMFIFTFCNIIVNDGTERAKLFLDRESSFTTFPAEFIAAIGKLDAKDIDSFPEFSEFIFSPQSFDFDHDFYDNLQSFIQKNPIPGAIVLLKHFLHNKGATDSQVLIAQVKDNHQINLKFRSELLVTPFHESNVPQLIQKPLQLNDHKLNRSFTSQSKRSMPKPPHLPSLTSIIVPNYAHNAAMDPTSCAFCYTYLNNIYYVSRDHKLSKLRPHFHSITAITFSPCGKFILSADCIGEIMIQSVDGKKFSNYQNIPETITSVAFYNRIFAVGTVSGYVYIYETNNRNILRVLLFHKASVLFLSIHPNCEYIASVSMDNTIRLCSITQANCVRLWKSQTKYPSSVRFSHDGQMLLVSCSEGYLYLYDIGTTKLIRSILIDAPLVDAIFSHNDQMIAIVDKTGGFSLWDTNDPQNDTPLTVLQIDRIKTIAMQFLESDEIRIIGNKMADRYFEELYR